MRKPQVGDTVYLKPINNQMRRSSEIMEREVKRVGRKYFYVAESKGPFHMEIKINIETMQEDQGGYSGDWQAYYSLQEIEDEKEQHHLSCVLRDLFGGWSRNGLTLDQLRRIKAITEEDNGDE